MQQLELISLSIPVILSHMTESHEVFLLLTSYHILGAKKSTIKRLRDNTSLPKDVLKSIAEPPDLACAHLFEPGAGCECGTPNLFGGIEGYVLYLQTFLFTDL